MLQRRVYFSFVQWTFNILGNALPIRQRPLVQQRLRDRLLLSLHAGEALENSDSALPSGLKLYPYNNVLKDYVFTQ